MCSVCGGRRAAGASPIRCVGERITATGVPEFREVAWRACDLITITFVVKRSSQTSAGTLHITSSMNMETQLRLWMLMVPQKPLNMILQNR
ncbi:hypothetical protein [Bathymodiolus japonicus methanotrophic gill symbiont]|uniref:hypothetical protein n=1 Tax=Bathymodiolus japonicus methanotrophic gill symbiont TaxID=113269 RepID=UPI001C8F1DA6|nr:hypothetical protein [Bathymodiolus japonicus methanotrophic gill symbiont]